MVEEFPGGLDMDDLYNRPFENESADEVEKSTLAPEGWYVTDPDQYTVTLSSALFDERRLLTVMTRAEGRVGGNVHTALLRFRISPDKRHAQVWEDGKPTGEEKPGYDMASILWTQLRNAYVGTVGEKPKTEAALIEFLKSSPVKVKVGHFQGKLSVKGIEKAR